MADPLDPVGALRRIAEGVEHWDAERDADSISVLWRIGDLARAALAALPAPESDGPLTFMALAKERLASHVQAGRDIAATGGVRQLTPDEEADQILATLSAAGLVPWPAALAAAPIPEGVPEDHRVCSHGIYHHGCPSCDRQDPEDR